MQKMQKRCLGITKNLNRCGRTEGDWKYFCDEHKKQPYIWVFSLLMFIIFTVLPGWASIYGTFIKSYLQSQQIIKSITLKDNFVILNLLDNNHISEKSIPWNDFVQKFPVIKDLQKELEENRKLLQRSEELFDLKQLKLSEKINTLQSELNQKETQLKEIIAQYEGKEIDKISARYQKAFNYFIKGELDKALKELDESKLDEEETKLEEKLKQQAETRILKGNILELQYRFEEAEKNYQKAVQLYSSYNTNFTIAHYYHRLNQFKLAEPYYQKCLELSSSKDQRARTLNNLGLLQRAKNEIELAEQSFKEALKIYRELATVNPKTYLPYVAMTLINLSIFYQKLKPNKEISLQLVDEAISLLMPFRELPYIQNYLTGAFSVLDKWGVDSKKYLKSKLQ